MTGAASDVTARHRKEPPLPIGQRSLRRALSAVLLASTLVAGAEGMAGAAPPHGGRHVVRTLVPSLRMPAPSLRMPGPVTPPDKPWTAPPRGPGHLAPGSDPSVLPGDVLVADKRNDRLVVLDPHGRVRWRFPQPGDLMPGQTFLSPDDAFFSQDGREIVVTQEDDSVVTVVDVATRHIVYRYGHPGAPGAAPGYLHNPDDAMAIPGGGILVADIANCRLLVLGAPAQALLRTIGTSAVGCAHDPPGDWGSPNGAFPMADGRYLVTEINGDWVDALGLDGSVAWSTHPPGVAYPSDSNEIAPGRYLTVDYSSPGQLVVFDRTGNEYYRYGPPSGPGALDHPSLALPLPNGDFLVNDDYHHRVVVIDPRTSRIVWQYGHDGVAGSAPGFLDNPDGVDLVPPHSLLVRHAATMGSVPLPRGGPPG